MDASDGQRLRTILAGVAIGAAGSLALTRTDRSLLFGVSANDPLTFVAVTLVLVGAALLACYFPARRAARVDPVGGAELRVSVTLPPRRRT
jgi:putative ABC transport system permease protein